MLDVHEISSERPLCEAMSRRMYRASLCRGRRMILLMSDVSVLLQGVNEGHDAHCRLLVLLVYLREVIASL